MARPIIVDANLFKGFYMETALNSMNSELTGSTLPIFQRLGSSYKIFLDEGDMIKSEWENTIGDFQWLKEWLRQSYISDDVKASSVNGKHGKDLLKALYGLGLPKSRDIWYVRTAVAAQEVSLEDRSGLLSEDLDFYSPEKKKKLKGKKRSDYIKSGRGKVAATLRGVKISVVCCSNCCDKY